MSGKKMDAIELVQEILVEAPPERVWKALTEETSEWWQKDFYSGASPRGYVIEPRIGGRAYEDWGDGEGFVWFQVVGVRRNEHLMLAGDTDERWGGPARHLTRFELSPEGDGTKVRLVEHVYGLIDAEKTKSSLDSGWKFLLGECFKPFVEAGRRPERPESVR